MRENIRCAVEPDVQRRDRVWCSVRVRVPLWAGRLFGFVAWDLWRRRRTV